MPYINLDQCRVRLDTGEDTLEVNALHVETILNSFKYMERTLTYKGKSLLTKKDLLFLDEEILLEVESNLLDRIAWRDSRPLKEEGGVDTSLDVSQYMADRNIMDLINYLEDVKTYSLFLIYSNT